MPRVIHTLREAASIDLAAQPMRPEPGVVLMCPPDHFAVIDVKNAFMAGNIGSIDRARARNEWEAVKRAFERLGRRVEVLAPGEGLEDMVFVANPALPGLSAQGERIVVLSHMRHASRRREVPPVEAWFRERGYDVRELANTEALFEGQGDALWHPGRRMLWGGYGHRTDVGVYGELSEIFDVPVVTLHLPTDSFYHLDTCFCPLDERTALAYLPAFTAEGAQILRHFFPRLIEVPTEEATNFFACNATCIDSRHVVLQRGATETVRALRNLGFETFELETGEFMKSGGSVFCMKLMVYA